jgi:hypothetical protein
MIRLLATLAVIIFACTPAQTTPASGEIHLRGTVLDVVPLAHFSGEVTPVDIDSSFALTVRVESVDPSTSGFNAHTVVTFAIHSPALLFGGEDPKRKKYDFSVQHEAKDGKTRFFGLKAKKAQTRRCEAAARASAQNLA